jgi:hypothetical protein
MGGLFGLIGSFGLMRLKDRMQRLHAPTKATTVGVGTALIGLAFEVWLNQGRLAGARCWWRCSSLPPRPCRRCSWPRRTCTGVGRNPRRPAAHRQRRRLGRF